MEKTRILIAGGTGAVGQHIARLLAARPEVMPVVGGRNAEKAAAFANRLHCEWTRFDVNDRDTISGALGDIDIVINCCIPSDNTPVTLAQTAVEQQAHYLDVSAFNGYCQRVTALDAPAREKGVTLITALGAYPGIPGLILADAGKTFQDIQSAQFYFVMGGRLAGLTPLSLMGVHYMMNVPPLVWDSGQWRKPKAWNARERISAPFNKAVYLSPGMITYDLFTLPDTMEIGNMAFWSGMENLVQGLVFFMGMKLGWASSEKRAARFLKLLKFLGSGRKNHPEMAIKAVVTGIKNGERVKQATEIHGIEDYLTAVVPVLVCDQLVHGQINRAGAFTGPQIVDAQALMQSFRDSVPGVEETRIRV